MDLKEVLEGGEALRHRRRPEVAQQVGLGSGEHPNDFEAAVLGGHAPNLAEGGRQVEPVEHPSAHPSGEGDSALQRGEVGLVAAPPKRRRIWELLGD